MRFAANSWPKTRKINLLVICSSIPIFINSIRVVISSRLPNAKVSLGGSEAGNKRALHIPIIYLLLFYLQENLKCYLVNYPICINTELIGGYTTQFCFINHYDRVTHLWPKAKVSLAQVQKQAFHFIAHLYLRCHPFKTINSALRYITNSNVSGFSVAGNEKTRPRSRLI